MSDIQLIRENERLKIYIENYKNQLKDLDEEHKNEIQKLKNERLSILVDEEREEFKTDKRV